MRVAGDGEAALDEAGVFEPDAVVLDLGLPRLDGVEVCRRLRDDGDVPILILTARDALEARVEGLDSGADDYLVKPFERDELLARLRALLRRRPPRGSAFLVVGDLRLNPDTREVLRGERELELTAREFELLEHLMRNERIVVSRQALLDEVWGYHPFAETNTVDVFISNLRRKLEAGRRAARAAHGARRRLRAEGRMRTRLPVRFKLAVVTAALTFGILCVFAVVIGAVAEQRIRAGFDDDLRATVADVRQQARRAQDARTARAVRRLRPLAGVEAGGAAGPRGAGGRHGRVPRQGGCTRSRRSASRASASCPATACCRARSCCPRRRRATLLRRPLARAGQRGGRVRPVRQAEGHARPHDQPRAPVPRLRRARRHVARLPRRPLRRRARDAADRRADPRRARGGAHARSGHHAAQAARQRRGVGPRQHLRGHAARAGRRALGRDRGHARRASATSWPTPRTSCARR